MNQQLLERLRDKSLEEIISMLLNKELTLDEFNREFVEEFPGLYLNIIFNFRTWENFEKFVILYHQN